MRSQRALLNVWEVINGYCWGKQLYEFLYCHISSMWVLCYFLFFSLVILSKTHKTERACGLIIRRKEVSCRDTASAWIEKPPGKRVDCSMVTKKPRAGQHLNCLSKRERRSWSRFGSEEKLLGPRGRGEGSLSPQTGALSSSWGQRKPGTLIGREGKRRENESQGRRKVEVGWWLLYMLQSPFLISQLGYFIKQQQQQNLCDSPLFWAAKDYGQKRYLHNHMMEILAVGLLVNSKGGDGLHEGMIWRSNRNF